MTSTLKDLIEQRLQALSPSHLTILDESHLHVGHAGAQAGGKHFAVQIISAQFEGMSLLKRHQLVYATLTDLLSPQKIHALKIKAKTPNE